MTIKELIEELSKYRGDALVKLTEEFRLEDFNVYQEPGGLEIIIEPYEAGLSLNDIDEIDKLKAEIKNLEEEKSDYEDRLSEIRDLADV